MRHFGASTVEVRFNDVAGEVILDRAVETGSADITVQMTSVDSGIPYFNAHLCSSEFFDVIKFPTARYVANRTVFEGGTLHRIEGELTLMGHTHPVELTCTHFAVYDNPLHKAEVCGGDFNGTIKRSLWGLTLGVPDEVSIAAQIEAVKH